MASHPALLAIALLLAAPAAHATPELLSEARAARSAGDLARAEALARQGMGTSSDAVWPLTLALVLTDAGRPAEALAILDAPHAPPLPERERLAAAGYAHVRAGDDWAALRAYGQLLLLAPDDAEARSSVAGILDRLRAPHGAAALDGIPDRRAADMAAARTRWGAQVRASDPARRFDGTDRALVDLDTLLARLAADPSADPALLRRVRLDRIVALRDRVRMDAVIAEAEALAPLPAFADHAYADALLYRRRPADALAAYDRVLAAQPGEISARYGRVFALIEQERLREAIAAADAILESRPRFRAFSGGPATTPDGEHAYAAQLAGEVRLWSGMVPDGIDRIAPLAAGAPASASLRRAHANALMARGHPRAAESEHRVAASMDPDSIATRLALADMALARNRLDEASSGAAALLALAPENLAVQRLDRDVRARKGWLFSARFQPDFNQGGGAFNVGDGYTLGAELLSPPILGPVRALAILDSAAARPPEGRVTRHRAGGGLVVEAPDVAARIYATHSWGTLPQDSVGAAIDWSLGDRFGIAVSGELNALDVPIRALVADIRGDTARIALRYRRDERFDLVISATTLDFTDGNNRLAIGGSAVQLLHAAPHLALRGRVDLYASRNSQPGGPYFAPASDWSLSGGLNLEHIAWRRYERILTQVASLDVGIYDQQGFDASWVGVVRYEHRWRQDPRTEIFYGVTLDRRVYDGVSERGVAVTLGVRQRL